MAFDGGVEDVAGGDGRPNSFNNGESDLAGGRMLGDRFLDLRGC